MHMHNFSKINEKRCNKWHPNGINSWSGSDWMTALTGEVGEAANIIKKLNRIRDGLVGNNEKENKDALIIALRKEFADIYIYLDLLSTSFGVDLQRAVIDKFNETTDKNGLGPEFKLYD